MNKKQYILTKRQKEVLDEIKTYIKKHHISPMVSELRDVLGVSSLRTVTSHLDALEKKGLIMRDKFKQRNIKLVDTSDYDNIPNTVVLPVVASAGCDDMTVFAQQEYDEYLTVDSSFTKGKSDLVVIKAAGSSMRDAGIENGDYVIVEKTATGDVQEGDRVVAIVGDMAVIKRIHFAPNAIVLQPESKNMGYKPIVMKEDFQIFGRVVDVISMASKLEPEITIEKIEGAEQDNNINF